MTPTEHPSVIFIGVPYVQNPFGLTMKKVLLFIQIQKCQPEEHL